MCPPGVGPSSCSWVSPPVPPGCVFPVRGVRLSRDTAQLCRGPSSLRLKGWPGLFTERGGPVLAQWVVLSSSRLRRPPGAACEVWGCQPSCGHRPGSGPARSMSVCLPPHRVYSSTPSPQQPEYLCAPKMVRRELGWLDPLLPHRPPTSPSPAPQAAGRGPPGCGADERHADGRRLRLSPQRLHQRLPAPRHRAEECVSTPGHPKPPQHAGRGVEGHSSHAVCSSPRRAGQGHHRRHVAGGDGGQPAAAGGEGAGECSARRYTRCLVPGTRVCGAELPLARGHWHLLVLSHGPCTCPRRGDTGQGHCRDPPSPSSLGQLWGDGVHGPFSGWVRMGWCPGGLRGGRTASSPMDTAAA